MTLLALNRCRALILLRRYGAQIDSSVVPDAFIVNVGDISTAGRTNASSRRCIGSSNRTKDDRYAIPRFCDPSHDTLIECLPTCVATQPAKYPPFKFGDYVTGRSQELMKHWRKAAPGDVEVAAGARATQALAENGWRATIQAESSGFCWDRARRPAARPAAPPG